jgi:hypothetical protein
MVLAQASSLGARIFIQGELSLYMNPSGLVNGKSSMKTGGNWSMLAGPAA